MGYKFKQTIFSKRINVVLDNHGDHQWRWTFSVGNYGTFLWARANYCAGPDFSRFMAGKVDDQILIDHHSFVMEPIQPNVLLRLTPRKHSQVFKIKFASNIFYAILMSNRLSRLFLYNHKLANWFWKSKAISPAGKKTYPFEFFGLRLVWSLYTYA